MKCPVCESRMELVTVVRKAKGAAQAIKCPECRTSTFLTKDAAARLCAAVEVPDTRSSTESRPPVIVSEARPAAASVEPDRVPTSLFEDFIAWLNS